ncbi:MAG: hypothetical protein JO090_13765 [Rhizobacter sp.]|nr:hypothetical protein [Rhizobacter sp.]
MSVPPRSAAAAAAAACTLVAALASACSAPRSRDVGAEAPPLRVMVKLVRGSEDAGAIGAQAGRIAGVPVSYAAATSAQWHAIALHCVSTAECDAAVARLRAASSVYQAVEIEGRKMPAAS